MATPNENCYLDSCADWFAFHLSHVKDLDLNAVESLWPDCEKCQAIYESLDYTSREGEFGLMTREVLDNIAKRKRDGANFRESYVRRGNVPKYVSIVAPMPVHLRPGTGKSSGYSGSAGISMVSEDLLMSAGTQEEHEEVVDSGEESGSECLVADKGLRFREGLGPSQDDQRVVSEDNICSPRSHLSSRDLESDANVEDGVDALGSELPTNDLEMNNNKPNDETAGDDGKENSRNLEEENQLDEMKDITANGLMNSSENGFDQFLDNILETDHDVFDENHIGLDDVTRRNCADNDEDYEEDEDNVDITDTSDGGLGKDTTNNLDSFIFDDKTLSNKENVPDNLDVASSEPFTTDSRPSPKADDEKRTTSKPIIKDDDGAKNKIYEQEVEASIMKRMTSPTEETGSIPAKPVIGRRETDLRPLTRPSIDISDYDRQLRNNMTRNNDLQGSESDENLSDGEFFSSSNDFKTRRSKPKKNIYAKRANLKTPREKIHRRKSSNDDSSENEAATGESSLLMEQILEQEKRLKEGMKPWLKGRLALSQQNSRFEIPMDVTLLENMTPMTYLSNYCVISKRRKALYKHVFQKVDRNRDGLINFTELDNALKDVHTGVLNSEHIENIIQMVNIDKESEFDLKQFSAVAAFSERISCKHQLPVELLNNLDGQKEVIESADFFGLSWKLDGVQVNPAVKKILDSL